MWPYAMLSVDTGLCRPTSSKLPYLWPPLSLGLICTTLRQRLRCGNVEVSTLNAQAAPSRWRQASLFARRELCKQRLAGVPHWSLRLPHNAQSRWEPADFDSVRSPKDSRHQHVLTVRLRSRQ